MTSKSLGSGMEWAGATTLRSRFVAIPAEQVRAPFATDVDSDHSIQSPGPRLRVGVISNQRAHRNSVAGRVLPEVGASMHWASPRTKDELALALARFAWGRVDALIIDGGDGTVRDVLSAAAADYPDALPRVAIVPSGKTNALALDLGIPADWTLDDAVAAIARGHHESRTPIEIRRSDDSATVLRGFLFGAGAFVRATALAQEAHGVGLFRGMAVGAALAAAIGQSLFGGAHNIWRQGEAIGIDFDDGRSITGPSYTVLASTLKRLPLGLKPFGKVRDGLKLLRVEAQPRRLWAAIAPLLAGSEAHWLRELGYHHGDVERVTLKLEHDFILDGEAFTGGTLSLARGKPVTFVTP